MNSICWKLQMMNRRCLFIFDATIWLNNSSNQKDERRKKNWRLIQITYTELLRYTTEATHIMQVYIIIFFSPHVFQKFKYFTNLIKTLYLLRTVDFEIYNVRKKCKIVQTIRKSCQHFYPSFVGNLSSYLPSWYSIIIIS